MDWLVIFGLGLGIITLWYTTSFAYKRGIKSGVRHSLMTLKLNTDQIEILNNELKKEDYDLAVESFFKEDLSSKDKLLN